MSMGF